MKKFLITNPKIWLASGLLVFLSLLVALVGADQSLAHRCCPTSTPMPTATSIPVPPPDLQPCQITAIIFDREAYTTADTINVTVRLADFRGTPLTGANVVPEITPLPLSAQLSTGFGLVDRAGDYEGFFGPFDEGLYRFNFTASDPTDERFLPCMGEVEVPVESSCELNIESVEFDQTQYYLGETITLTAMVTTDGEPFSAAEVTANVDRPDGSTGEIELTSIGDGHYRGEYLEADLEGDYDFEVTATDPDGLCEPVTSQPPPVPVVLPECELSLDSIAFDKDRYVIDEAITLTATVTSDGEPFTTAEVTAVVTRPDDTTEPLQEFGHVGNGRYLGEYAVTDLEGSYSFEVTATDPAGRCVFDTTQSPPVPVTQPAIVTAVPQVLTTTLCSLRDTVAINAQNVPDLFEVQLELSYDPRVIQVIDADRAQSGVQVRPGSLFATSVIRNEVDWRNGHIFFVAQRLNGQPTPGSIGLIAIDWRPQRVGSSAVTLERVILRNHDGQPIEVESQDGLVNVTFVPDCRIGTIALEGRSDHSGVIVGNATGQTVQTEADGYFAIIGGDRLSFELPGYLSTETDLRETLAAGQADDEPVNLGTVNMQAGDVNGDNRVDILDLAFIAQRYLTVDSVADINADGRVNILDLALVGGNYQQQGPLTVGQ